MNHLETELKLLKEDLLEMMSLVSSQLKKGKKSVFDFDKELANEVDNNERRVNALELKIDRDCENILALFNPVAIDLRFVLASFKLSGDLERMGDNAQSIARYMLDFERPIPQDYIETLQLNKMFDNTIGMLEEVFNAFEAEDSNLSRKIFSRDKILNEINRESAQNVAKLIQKNDEDLQTYLYLFSIIRKLERIGDLAKNTAEEIVFYVEAKVLKHQRRKNRTASGN